MDKKKMLIIGIIAIAGIGYYMYTKSKKPTTDESDSGTGDSGTGTGTGDSGTGTGTTETGTTETGATETATTKSGGIKPLETRKDKKKACGRRPLIKKKREEWQKCVDSGGVASFDGDYDNFDDNFGL
jgi:hypothetical protein